MTIRQPGVYITRMMATPGHGRMTNVWVFFQIISVRFVVFRTTKVLFSLFWKNDETFRQKLNIFSWELKKNWSKMVEISKYKQSPAAPSDEASRTGTLNTFQQEYAKSVIPRWKKRNRGYKPLMNMLTTGIYRNLYFLSKTQTSSP